MQESPQCNLLLALLGVLGCRVGGGPKGTLRHVRRGGGGGAHFACHHRRVLLALIGFHGGVRL